VTSTATPAARLAASVRTRWGAAACALLWVLLSAGCARPAAPPPQAGASLERALDAASSARWAEAREELQSFAAAWPSIEDSVRAVNPQAYEKIEDEMTTARAALQAEPPDAERARESIADLSLAFESYGAGGSAGAAERVSLSDLVGVAEGTQRSFEAGDLNAGAASLQQLKRAWTAAEGEVKAKSPRAYEEIEDALGGISSVLLSQAPDSRRAADLSAQLVGLLEPLTQGARYTAWDAALILLREGLEAMLAIASLLALLRKTGQTDKQSWVWTGVGGGVAVSAVLGIALSLATAAVAAGSAREAIEGLVGLAAVILMLTVGAWLHGKSSIQAWNAFIKEKAGGALARGSTWSLASIAFLAIAREGAETVVFYIGIAPSIAPGQMALGIFGALVPLAGLGYVLMRYSVRLPLRQLFLGATLLIYYLAFKILGESIHALQMAGLVPVHATRELPALPPLGMYSSWETFVPQALVALLVLAELLLTELRHRKAAGTAPASRGA
jgi:high-affinity iron transporter